MAVHHNRPYLVIPHDGYTWLKYGQKILSHTKLTRAYFRCANFKVDLCPARKFVDFNHRDPGGEPPRLTYQKEHTHPPMNPAFTGPAHAPPDPGGAPIFDASDAREALPMSQVEDSASGPSQILMKASGATTSKDPAACPQALRAARSLGLAAQGPGIGLHTPGQGEEVQAPGGEFKPLAHSAGQGLDLRDAHGHSSQAGGVLSPKTDMQDPVSKQGTLLDCAAMTSAPTAAEGQGGRLLRERGQDEKGGQGIRPENRLDSPQSSSWLADFDLGRTEGGLLDWGAQFNAPSETVEIQETDDKEEESISREDLPGLERAPATKGKGKRNSIDASWQNSGKRMKLEHGCEGQGTRENNHPAQANHEVHSLGYGIRAKEGHNREQWRPTAPGSQQQSQGLQEMCQWSSSQPSGGANDSRSFLQGIPNQQGLWAGNHPQQQMQTHYQPSANMIHGQEIQSSHVLTQPSSLMVGPSGPQGPGSDFHLGPARVDSQPPVLQPGSWSFGRTSSAEQDQRFSMDQNRSTKGMNSSGVTQNHQQNRFQQRTQEQRLLQHPQAQSVQDLMPQHSASITHAVGNQPPLSSQQIPGGHMSQAQSLSTGIAHVPQVWNTSSNSGMQGIGQDFSRPLMPVQNASLQFRGTAENSAQNQYFPPPPSVPAQFSQGPPPHVWLPDDATRQMLHVPQVWCSNVPYNTPCNTNHGVQANQVPPSHVGPTSVTFLPPVPQDVPPSVMHMARHPHEGGHQHGQGNQTTCMTCNPQPYSAAPMQSSLDAAQLQTSAFNTTFSGAVSNAAQSVVSSQHPDSIPGPIAASSSASTDLLSPPPMGWSRSSEHM